MLVLAGGPGPVAAVGAGALLGFGFSFPWTAVASTVLRRAPSAERGSAVAILSAFYDLSVGLSSFAAGWMAHQFGYSASFVMAAVALVAAAFAGKFVFFGRTGGTDPRLSWSVWMGLRPAKLHEKQSVRADDR